MVLNVEAGRPAGRRRWGPAGKPAGRRSRGPAGRLAGGAASAGTAEPATTPAAEGRRGPEGEGPVEESGDRATFEWTRSTDCRRRARSRRTQQAPQVQRREQGERWGLEQSRCQPDGPSSSCSSAWGRHHRSEEGHRRSLQAGERSQWRQEQWRGQQGAAPC
jgi:hypothetical protein